MLHEFPAEPRIESTASLPAEEWPGQYKLDALLRRRPDLEPELMKAANITAETMESFRDGSMAPHAGILAVIAETFDISTDWLLGFGAHEKSRADSLLGCVEAYRELIDLPSPTPEEVSFARGVGVELELLEGSLMKRIAVLERAVKANVGAAR